MLELLIVVAIIAILAAIAIPNFLEAQTRSKVSAAKANLRTLSTGLESYAVDHNQYPPAVPVFPADPLALYSDVQLARLTTPLSYITASAFRDPFGTIQSRSLVPGPSPRTAPAPGDNFPELTPPNLQRSLLYYHYPSLSRRYGLPAIDRFGAAAISIGPDLADSLGAYRPFSADFFRDEFQSSVYRHPLDTVYDPTNGTISPGDIGVYSGEAGRFEVP